MSVGRIGSKWMETVCNDLDIPTKSNRVDIGVRVELPVDEDEYLAELNKRRATSRLKVVDESKVADTTGTF